MESRSPRRKSAAFQPTGTVPSNWLWLTNSPEDRPWQGTFHLVAVYGRGLTAKEIAQNYAAGPDGTITIEALAKVDPRQRLFETKIAPLFANHCLECHDSASKQGLLDLKEIAGDCW